MGEQAVLQVEQLVVGLPGKRGQVSVVRGIDFTLRASETLAIVGESGCGKSMTALALMGLLPPRSQVTGRVDFQGQNLLRLSARQRNTLRGSRMAMIFQEPATALNPTMSVGMQVAEVLYYHAGLNWRQAEIEVVRIFGRCGIESPEHRFRQYPFEFSGGMLQRVMIAMAIAAKPALLIADEPTTALDVTVQRQVLSLLRELQQEEDLALLLITHDLGVVSGMADQVAVMYAGQFVETCTVAGLYEGPSHPYTRALLAALPSRSQNGELVPLGGLPPDLDKPLPPCAFLSRCPSAMVACAELAPPWIPVAGGQGRCWLLDRRDALME